MTKTLDDDTQASHPGGFPLSRAKLKLLQPELFGPLSWIGWDWENGKPQNRASIWLTRIEEQLLFGDSRAAVVVSTSPLLVAAYTDEIDCVALLRFSRRFISEYNLERGSRLVTVNTYEFADGSYETDLKPGPESYGTYGNVFPMIADFLTDDVARLAERKLEISEDEWRRTETLGQSYRREKYARPRDGRPCWSFLPAERLPSDLPDIEPPKPAAISILEVPKRILMLVFFIAMLLWGVFKANVNSRAGVFALAVFGSMLVISIVYLLRLPRDLKTRVSIREAHSLKKSYMWIGAVAVSFLLGVAGEVIFASLRGFWPNFAIWVSAFLTTLALYPFRDDEMKRDYPTLKSWAVLSCLWGLLSVGLAHLSDWLS